MPKEPKFVTIEQKSLLIWIGVFLVFLLFAFGGGLYLGQSWQKADKSKSTPPWLAKNPPPPPQEEPVPEQRLTFYDQLTEKSGKTSKATPPEPSANKEVKESSGSKESKSSSPRAKMESKIAKEESPPPATKGNYIIHLASVKSQAGAESMAAKLQKKGYKVVVKEVDLGEKGIWYRLLMVGYTSKEEAEATAEKLRKKEGLTPIVRAGKE